MAERGSTLNRLIDKSVGVVLMPFVALYRRLRRRQPTPMRRIAILAMGAIGDTVLLSGLINAIHNKIPNIKIYVYTSRANGHAAALLSNVTGVYSYPLVKLFAMVLHMRKQHYDLLLDSTQWARIGSLISALSNASLTVGFKTKGQLRSMPYDIITEHSNERHEWKNFLALGQVVFPGIHAKPGLVPPHIPGIELPPEPFIVCHMWTTGSNARERLWTNKKWAILIDKLTKRGFNIVLTGAGDDAEMNEGMKMLYTSAERNEQIFIGAGKYNLIEFTEVMSKAVAMVSVNTGSMHIAALLGVPTVGIHGPTSPRRWGPAGPKAVSVQPEGARSFLNLGYEKVPDDAYSYRVEVEQVLGALEKLGVL